MFKTIDSGFDRAHNQAIGKLFRVSLENWNVSDCMNPAILQTPTPRQEASLVTSDLRVNQIAASHTPFIDELVHDLRQPLSVIESLAYYLELRSADEKVSAQLRKIQAMVFEAHTILERFLPIRTT